MDGDFCTVSVRQRLDGFLSRVEHSEESFVLALQFTLEHMHPKFPHQSAVDLSRVLHGLSDEFDAPLRDLCRKFQRDVRAWDEARQATD